MADDITTYATALLLRAAVALFPDGGQGAARRNAWQAMVADASLARARREAEESLAGLTRPTDAAAHG